MMVHGHMLIQAHKGERDHHETNDVGGSLRVLVDPLHMSASCAPRLQKFIDTTCKLTGIRVENSHDELLSARRDLLVFRKLVAVLLDTFVDSVDVLGLKGWLANE